MEAKIQIGDHVLTEGQAKVLRIAIQAEAETEKFQKEMGEELAAAYYARLGEIVAIILRETR